MALARASALSRCFNVDIPPARHRLYGGCRNTHLEVVALSAAYS